MPVRFAKYEGLGNDFVVIERAELSDVSPAQAIAWCDRHLGVGADGVLLVDRASPSMRVINADGSVPEMCGNGLRCVVWHLARVDALPGGDEVVVQTGAGPHACRLLRGEGSAARTANILKAPGSDLRGGREAPLAQVSPLSFPFSFSF